MDPNPRVPLSDGNFMPLIGLGMQNFRPNDKTFNVNDIVMKAANAGYTHFDITHNEQLIGEALRLMFEAKRQAEDEDGEKIPDQWEQSFPREQMFISYKVYNTPDIKANVKQALQSNDQESQL